MYSAKITKERIRTLCKIKNINAKIMLLECKLGANAIQQINDTKGLASFSLAKIADYLDCSVDYLLGRTEDAGTNLNVKEEEMLGIFRKLNEEKQNKVIGYAEAQLNDDDNIYYIGYNAAMGGERTETRHTKEETKKLIDTFEAEFEKDVPPIE